MGGSMSDTPREIEQLQKYIATAVTLRRQLAKAQAVYDNVVASTEEMSDRDRVEARSEPAIALNNRTRNFDRVVWEAKSLIRKMKRELCSRGETASTDVLAKLSEAERFFEDLNRNRS